MTVGLFCLESSANFPELEKGHYFLVFVLFKGLQNNTENENM
jgi:hypothetical protein